MEFDDISESNMTWTNVYKLINKNYTLIQAIDPIKWKKNSIIQKPQL